MQSNLNSRHFLILKGTSTVKYTIALSYIDLIESNLKIYTNFEFYKVKNHKHMKNMLSYKAKQFMLIRKLKKSQQILEDGASSVQIGILNM